MVDKKAWTKEDYEATKEKLANTTSLQEYIDLNELLIIHSIDTSPYGVARQQQVKMLNELKALLERKRIADTCPKCGDKMKGECDFGCLCWMVANKKMTKTEYAQIMQRRGRAKR